MGEAERMLLERADRIENGNDGYPTNTPALLRETAELIEGLRAERDEAIADLAAERAKREAAEAQAKLAMSRAIAERAALAATHDPAPGLDDATIRRLAEHEVEQRAQQHEARERGRREAERRAASGG